MSKRIFSLKGKVVLVTGGGRGIGKEIAKLFVKQGAEVIIISDVKKDLEESKAEIIKNVGKVDFVVCDNSKEEDIKKVMNYILSKYKKLDILVNNAGFYKENVDTHKLELKNNEMNIKFNEELINKLISVDVLAYWRFGLYAAEIMKKQKKGVIINISSVNAICGKCVCDIYDMTKAAVNVLTLNQAMQLAEYNIRVNAICPSSVVTSMRDRATAEYLEGISREEYDKKEASTIPLGRIGKAEDIAYCALYLASDEANYLTGQIISVDGGFLLTRNYPEFNI